MPKRPLTERQRQCVALSATLTDKEIGRHLGISPGTVNKHMQEAMDRLDVNTRKSALRALGYIPPSLEDPIPSSDGIASVAFAEADRERPRHDPVDYERGYRPPPKGVVARLTIVALFVLLAAVVGIAGASILNAGLGLAQEVAPPGVR